MSERNVNRTVDELTIEQWLQIRKQEGRKIDPDTAEVWWDWSDTSDPYRVYPHPPGEVQCVGRVYFACSPGSDIWVSFRDLSDETERQLWERHKSVLAFPAGLEWKLCRRDSGQGKARYGTATQGLAGQGEVGRG